MSKYFVDTKSVDQPIGTIIYYAGDSTTLPSGWLICDGTSLSTSTYSELYSLIGTSYGGSGSSFNIPNLTGKRIRSSASFSNTTSTNVVGNGTVSLDGNHMPLHNHGGTNWSHNHSLNDNQKFHDNHSGSGYPQYRTVGNSNYNDANEQVRFKSGGSGTGNTNYSGNGAAFTINPAYLSLHAIIKVS